MLFLEEGRFGGPFFHGTTTEFKNGSVRLGILSDFQHWSG
jgi:hypothetical protein